MLRITKRGKGTETPAGHRPAMSGQAGTGPWLLPPVTPLPVAAVIGALIGRQEGRNIEVMNSFELLAHAVEETVLIDKEYYYTKEEQFKQVFKDMEFLGWYTTGGPPDQSDIHVHKQVRPHSPPSSGERTQESWLPAPSALTT
ncbi:COP9 signalosome complex subunit 6-like, partial [Chelonoidis abingdonii]|uniref:COP9 signalosome complex subunit 6-like n=1 Tax=Chelonoidis abingdonii TaxID=106734 RepID=UPI003F495A0C